MGRSRPHRRQAAARFGGPLSLHPASLASPLRAPPSSTQPPGSRTGCGSVSSGCLLAAGRHATREQRRVTLGVAWGAGVAFPMTEQRRGVQRSVLLPRHVGAEPGSRPDLSRRGHTVSVAKISLESLPEQIDVELTHVSWAITPPTTEPTRENP